MSFLTKIIDFITGLARNPASVPAPTLSKPISTAKPIAIPTATRSLAGIHVDFAPRFGDQKKLTFDFDQPEQAFRQAHTDFLIHPLHWSSIKGVRINTSGVQETIFEIKISSDHFKPTLDLVPTFPGSWIPPEDCKAVHSVRK